MYSEEYLKDKLFLSTSLFFTSIFNHLKKRNQNNEGIQNIFEEAFKQFKTLTYLFEKIPNSKIKQEIFDICLKAVRKNENRIKTEIALIQTYFKIKFENANKIEEIAESLKLYSKKNQTVNIINGISLFLDRKKIKFTNYFNKLMNIKKDLSSININSIRINEYLRELSKDNLNIIDVKSNINNDYLYIFIDFYKKPDAFDFLLSLSEEDCRNFQEMIDISDNNFLNSSDIQDLEKCRKFLSEIKSDDKNPLTDKLILEEFINKAQENKNISLYFNSFFNNYSQIKELKSQKFEKIETNKTKSKKISKDSLFILSINNNNKNKEINEIYSKQDNTFVLFKGEYKSLNQDNNQYILKGISFQELLELREVSILNKNLEKENKAKKEESYEYNKKFIENIKEIINIYNLLEQISKKFQ